MAPEGAFSMFFNDQGAFHLISRTAAFREVPLEDPSSEGLQPSVEPGHRKPRYTEITVSTETT